MVIELSMRGGNAPVSLRRDSVLDLDQLGQDAVARFRMDKGDSPTVGAGSRLLIDQANASSRQFGEGFLDIGNSIGDVVHPFAALGHEASNCALGISRLD